MLQMAPLGQSGQDSDFLCDFQVGILDHSWSNNLDYNWNANNQFSTS